LGPAARVDRVAGGRLSGGGAAGGPQTSVFGGAFSRGQSGLEQQSVGGGVEAARRA
jgi:hypothetical protein